MTDDNEAWSPTALVVCKVCQLFWLVFVLSGCTYIVFWMNQHGAWYVLAVLLCCSDCKAYRSPAQIREWAKLPKDSQ